VVYNHYDSYVNRMGGTLFEQLVELLRSFGGNVALACRHWGELVGAIIITDSEVQQSHPLHAPHAFEDLEERLHSTLPLALYDGAEELCLWIEYVWVLDFDKGSLLMQRHGKAFEWPFFYLYRGRDMLNKWIEEADAKGEAPTLHIFTDAVRREAAVIIQASARRYLVMMRELRPGGVLVKLAQRRFFLACEAFETRTNAFLRATQTYPIASGFNEAMRRTA